MSFDTVTQRLQELRALSSQDAATARPAAGSPAAGAATGATFANSLAVAQSGAVQMGLAGAPANSMASGLPVLQAQALGVPSGAAASFLVGPGGAAGAPGFAGGYGTYAPYGAPGAVPGWGGTLAPVQGPQLPGMYPGSDVGSRMVALAQGELGVRETNGSNEGPRIREYRKATAGAENIPGPWCAYFVSWLAQQSGAPVGADGKGSGYVPTLESWGKQTGRFYSEGQQPRPGDIVIFDRNGDGLSDHTGIVERMGGDGTLHTIEGNTSDMVARRTYAASSAQVKGFVRVG